MSQFRNVNEAAEYIIDVLKEFIPDNTIFIATNDDVQNTIIKAYNRDEKLVQEGDYLPLVESYCSLVFKGASQAVIIPDTAKDPVTSRMQITKHLGSNAFIGVPIAISQNATYGTICVMSKVGREYEEKEIKLLEAMASLIGFVADLENNSIKDELTGVYNRKYFENYNPGKRNQDIGQQMSVMFIDIDDFKKINDTYGHEVGDAVLLEVTRRLKENIRNTDVIVRMGGDEFLVIIECTKNDKELQTIAKKLLFAIEKPVHIGEHTITVSISIGISRGSLYNLSINDLVKQADQAMYGVKRRGKGTFRMWE